MLLVGAAAQTPVCNMTDPVQHLMCNDANAGALWLGELIDDRHNAQFTYSREELRAIAAHFPSEGVSRGRQSNARQAALLTTILQMTEVLLAMTASLPQPLSAWQERRAAQLSSIHARFLTRQQAYLADPTKPLINVIPKWYHGYYDNVEKSLQNKAVTPDMQPSGRNFSSIWIDHKPGEFYGPVWTSYDSGIESREMRNSYYASAGDGNMSSWYMAFLPTPALPLFTDDGKLNAVEWVYGSETELANLTAMAHKHLTSAEAAAMLSTAISSQEARLQDVVTKLARVYSADRANLIAAVTLLPQWAQYTRLEYGFIPGFNWCSAKVCLQGADSAENMAVAVSSLPKGTILQTWGNGDEISSILPKFLIVVEAAADGALPVVVDVELDISFITPGKYPVYEPLRRRISRTAYENNATTFLLSNFAHRRHVFETFGVSTVQVFGTVDPSVDISKVPDVYKVMADGLWEDRTPVFPYEYWSNDCGGAFCQGVCEYGDEGPDSYCVFVPWVYPKL